MRDPDMIYSINDNIFNIIKRVIKQEEAELKALCGKGIFFMPEIALVYSIGKEIYINRELVFGNNDVEWLREVTFTNAGGPSDLVFQLPTFDEKYLYWNIEFKIAGTKEGYLNDIEKLNRLDDDHEGLFCAITDSWLNKPDERASIFENESLIPINYSNSISFETKTKYSNQIEARVHFGLVKRFKIKSDHILPEINPNASIEDKYFDAAQREAIDEHIANKNNTSN
jgi:hypothetical protein